MTEMIWVFGLVVIVAIAGAALFAAQRQRSRQLRTHFGPEYDHAVGSFGDRRAAERALVDRTRRVDKLQIRPLSQARRDELHDRWQAVQAQFVDDPTAAIEEAHGLLSTVMREEGYPAAKYEDEVELLSVHHPAAVAHYRAAQRLAADRARGQGNTEELRQAMIHYRALFEDLLNHTKEMRREA